MKLVSLNVEGARHFDRVLPFLIKENPSIIVLLEAPDFFAQMLLDLGYFASFAPMLVRTQEGRSFQEGVLIASRQVHTSHPHYYYRANPDIVPFVKDDKRNTISHVALQADIGGLQLVATHFTWNSAGETADVHQKSDMRMMLSYLNKLPPHVLCGDLNIPRNENALYDLLCAHYTDNIPAKYHSSLDRSLHRLGQNPDMDKLFDRFMVDYVFTQAPFEAANVRLEFGISDHAAVVADIAGN